VVAARHGKQNETREVAAVARPRTADGPAREDYARHTSELMDMGREQVGLSDPQAVEERCAAYLALCEQESMNPTVPGLALALGRTPEEMARCPTTPLIMAYRAVESMSAQMAQDGRIPMAVYIFQAKNWFGYRDQQDVRVTGEVAQASPKEVEARYAKVGLVEQGSPAGARGGRGGRRRRALPD
jgi:hypothetical protein